jgi:hypothetical protein
MGVVYEAARLSVSRKDLSLRMITRSKFCSATCERQNESALGSIESCGARSNSPPPKSAHPARKLSFVRYNGELKVHSSLLIVVLHD